MLKHTKYRPYIRKANGKEKSETLRMAFRLAFYQSIGQPFYVLVQRGFKNLVIDVGSSKKHIEKNIFTVAIKRNTFKQWTFRIQKNADPHHYRYSRGGRHDG